MKLNTETRMENINEIVERLTSEPHDREKFAQWIEAAAVCGRSEKWKLAITNWAAMVRDEKNPVSWAVLQGAIWAGYAA